MSKHTGQQAPHEIETKKSIYRVFDREKSDAAHETNTEQQQIADVIMEPPLVASSLRLVVAQEMVPNDVDDEQKQPVSIASSTAPSPSGKKLHLRDV